MYIILIIIVVVRTEDCSRESKARAVAGQAESWQTADCTGRGDLRPLTVSLLAVWPQVSPSQQSR